MKEMLAFAAQVARAKSRRELISTTHDYQCRVVDADGSGFHLIRGADVDISYRGVADRAITLYQDVSLQAGDPLATAMGAQLVPVHDAMLFDWETWRRQPIVSDAAGLFDLAHYMMSPVVANGKLVAALAFVRNMGRPAFTDADRLAAACTSLYVSSAYASLSEPSGHWGAMTPKEWHIAARVAQGLSNPEIAVDVGLTINGVKSALKSIFRKIDVSSRAELAWRFAQEAQLPDTLNGSS